MSKMGCPACQISREMGSGLLVTVGAAMAAVGAFTDSPFDTKIQFALRMRRTVRL